MRRQPRNIIPVQSPRRYLSNWRTRLFRTASSLSICLRATLLLIDSDIATPSEFYRWVQVSVWTRPCSERKWLGMIIVKSHVQDDVNVTFKSQVAIASYPSLSGMFLVSWTASGRFLVSASWKRAETSSDTVKWKVNGLFSFSAFVCRNSLLCAWSMFLISWRRPLESDNQIRLI
jgi:hypothetical protein